VELFRRAFKQCAIMNVFFGGVYMGGGAEGQSASYRKFDLTETCLSLTFV
jgi:hypothetical protein